MTIHVTRRILFYKYVSCHVTNQDIIKDCSVIKFLYSPNKNNYCKNIFTYKSVTLLKHVTLKNDISNLDPQKYTSLLITNFCRIIDIHLYPLIRKDLILLENHKAFRNEIYSQRQPGSAFSSGLLSQP